MAVFASCRLNMQAGDPVHWEPEMATGQDVASGSRCDSSAESDIKSSYEDYRENSFTSL